jgi:hypothetical protein
MDTAKILRAVRMALLVLIVAFLGLTVYRYFLKGAFEWTTVMPIFGLAFFYLITGPKASAGN